MDRGHAITFINVVGNGVVIPVALEMLNVPRGLILAIALVSILVVWRLAHKPSRLLFVGACAFAMFVTVLAIVFAKSDPQPSINDIRVSFIPEKFDGPDLYGRIVVKNMAKIPFEVKGYRIVFSNEGSETKMSDLNIAPAGGSISYPVVLYWYEGYGGRVSFRAQYNFGKKKSIKDAYAEFSITPGIQIGTELAPTKCCDIQHEDFISQAHDDDLRISNSPKGTHEVEVSEKTSSGKPMRVWITRPRREFIFDSVERFVRFRSIIRGKWYELNLPLERNFNENHTIRFRWHEPNGFMGLTVDGVDRSFDVDTGQIRTINTRGQDRSLVVESSVGLR